MVWPPYAGVWVQAVGVAPAHGGQLGGTGGLMEGGLLGGCRSTSIVPGGQEPSRDPAGEWGPFSKERPTGAPFLTPRSLYSAVYLIPLTLSLSPSLIYPPSPAPPWPDRLIHWLKCDFGSLCVNQLSYETALPPSPPSRPLVPLTYSLLELNRAVALCFSIILSTSKSLMRGWKKGGRGHGRDKSLWLFPHTMLLI